MRFPILLRAATIGIVAAAILVPLNLVTGKIAERQKRAAGVQADFARETSGPQVLSGPLLALECEETVVLEREVKRNGKEETIAEKKVRACPTAYFTPRTLDVSGRVPIETRHRGIYPIPLYRADLSLSGEFDWPAPPSPDGAISRTWRDAAIVVAVEDTRGIKRVTPLSWAESTVDFTPDRDGEARFALTAPLGGYAKAPVRAKIPFRFTLELMGTQSLRIAPIGDATSIRLASDWPHPSFIGAFPPDERKVNPGGFEAAWRVTHFATGGSAAWQPRFEHGRVKPGDRLTGFAVVDPVNVYSLSYRAAEYGFLFVLFTFAGLALAEALAGLKLHAIQYALVGSALAVFFLLLIALAEHIAFNHAYLAAAAACVALLTFYLRHPLGSWPRTGIFFALFVALYGSLFGILQSEDYALLAGSVLVFAVLAVGMMATRRLDWSATFVSRVPAG